MYISQTLSNLFILSLMWLMIVQNDNQEVHKDGNISRVSVGFPTET